MASYTELKREALKLRKKAIKMDIPSQYLAMADSKIDKAIFSRQSSVKERRPEFKRLCYRRAVSEMVTASDILMAHTTRMYEYRNEKGNRYKHLALLLDSSHGHNRK